MSRSEKKQTFSETITYSTTTKKETKPAQARSKKDFFGNKYVQHYDENGHKAGLGSNQANSGASYSRNNR